MKAEKKGYLQALKEVRTICEHRARVAEDCRVAYLKEQMDSDARRALVCRDENQQIIWLISQLEIATQPQEGRSDE